MSTVSPPKGTDPRLAALGNARSNNQAVTKQPGAQLPNTHNQVDSSTTTQSIAQMCSQNTPMLLVEQLEASLRMKQLQSKQLQESQTVSVPATSLNLQSTTTTTNQHDDDNDQTKSETQDEDEDEAEFVKDN